MPDSKPNPALTDAMPEAAPAPCGGCEAQRLTPLACGSCGLLSDEDRHPSPFQLFGLAPTWTICPAELHKRMMRITRLTHPDLHAASEEQAHLAERHTAELNEAYKLLLDDLARTEWLIDHLGGPPASKGVPQALLMEVMEWNETLDDLESEPDDEARQALIHELQVRRHATLQSLREILDPLPEPGAPTLKAARDHLDVLRYLARILARTQELPSH